MKHLKITFGFAVILTFSQAKAQTVIASKFIQAITCFHQINYTSFTNNETPFGDSKDTIKAYVVLNKASRLEAFKFITPEETDIFNSDITLFLSLGDKTYRTGNDYRLSPYYYNSLPELASAIKNTLIKSPQKIKQLADTTISYITCYHIRLSTLDTLIQNKHAYTFYDIYLNKKSILPVYAENHQQGYIEKGGILSDNVFQMTKRNTFTNYQLNNSAFPDLTAEKVPPGFKPENTGNLKTPPLLPVGTIAPDWKLMDLNGHTLSTGDIRNKLTIIDFSGNYCAACILSLPHIEALRTRYKNDKSIQFVTIDGDDTPQSVAKFMQKYKFNYPIYVNGKSVKDAFHVTSVPTFYLIDKQGKIAATFDGFSNSLEKDLTELIEKLK